MSKPKRRGPTHPELAVRWKRGTEAQKLVYREPQKGRRAGGREVVAALEHYAALIDEPAFVEAAQAMRKHGLDRQDAGTLKKLHVKAVGDTEKECVAFMDLRLRQQRSVVMTDGKPSVRRAAMLVAAEYLIPGRSFEGVVTRLESAYRRFEKERIKQGRVVYGKSPWPSQRRKKGAHVFSQ